METTAAASSTETVMNGCNGGMCNNAAVQATIRGNLIKSLSAPATPNNNEKSNGNGSYEKRPASTTAAARRVSFPADELLVTGYVEPPNPWQNAVNVTTMKLVDAYVDACKRYDVTALTKVTQQLQKIENFDKRADCLDLQGERLDSGQIEALEEVFKRVQFVAINLADTSLDDEGSTALFDIIEYYESVEKLNISHNKNISMRGWQNCCRMIKRTQCLHELNASGITVGDSIHILQRTLRGCPHLVTLRLENCSLAGRHFTVLMSALKCNSSLKELYLGENKLSSSDAIQICNFLRVNSRLKLLNLANNQLEDKGVLQITDGLSSQAKNMDATGKGLVDLNLFNNHFTFKSMPHLACALMDSRSLRVLDIGHNNINNEGIHCLKEALMRNRTLRELGLKGCRITCEGAVALAEFVADSPTIDKLNLSDNGIRIGGLMALAHSMKVNQSVTKLDVEGCCPAKEAIPEVEHRQQLDLLSELVEYCDRNYEIQEKRREDEEEEEEDRKSSDELVSEPVSRLLSLWANQPPNVLGSAARKSSQPASVPVPPPITISSVAENPNDSWQAVRGLSHYSLRSPQPSPSSSPIPSPTRNRFRVTRVFQEADSVRGAEENCLKPSDSRTTVLPPPPMATVNGVAGGGRFGRFKFTVTPVRTLDGVDTSLPPLAAPDDDGSSTDRSEDDRSPPPLLPPPSAQIDSLDEQVSPTDGEVLSESDVDDSNDSVFLESPVAVAPTQRLRHDSMTFYRKKRDKEMRRSHSLPVELLGSAEVLRPTSNLKYNDDFASNFCYSIYGGRASGGDDDSGGDSWSSEAIKDGVEVQVPLHSSPAVDSTVSERLSSRLLLKNTQEDINGNIKLIVATADDGTNDTASMHGTNRPDVMPDGDLQPSWEDSADSSLVPSSVDADVAVATDDRDDASSSGDHDSGIYLLDSSGDDLEMLHLDGVSSKAAEVAGESANAAAEEQKSELIERLLSDSCESSRTSEAKTSEVDDAARAVMPHQEDALLQPFTEVVEVVSDESDSGTAATDAAMAVCFSLVDVGDDYATFVQQQEYSRTWVLQTMAVTAAYGSESPADFCKSPSCSSLDLLTGDDDAATLWSLPPHFGVVDPAACPCDGFAHFSVDLMSFGEQCNDAVDCDVKDAPAAVSADPVPEENGTVLSSLQRRLCHVDNDKMDLNDGAGDGSHATGQQHTDRVSVWVNGHTPACQVVGDGAAGSWMPSGSPVSVVQKNLETLVRHVVLEGSESSSSSDSGVPESPISCSPPPPPLEVSQSPSFFHSKKSFCSASKSSGSSKSLGFDLLNRLDLKSAARITPGQAVQNKGMEDVAAEFLIQREAQGDSILETTQRETSSECPDDDGPPPPLTRGDQVAEETAT